MNLNPSMSGDGRIVAFESTEDIAGAGGVESFHAIRANISVDPPTYHQLGAARAPAPAISQDGSRIAFASKDNPLGTNNDGNSEIFLHDGAKLIQITNTGPGDIANRTTNGNFLPSISDDGRFIAFSSNRDLTNQNADRSLEIFIYDTVAAGFIQFTNASGIVGFTDAKISGDAVNVAYIRDSAATPSVERDLLLQNRVGPPTVRVLATAAQALAMTYGRAISDDGLRVVWAADTAATSSQVFLYDGRNNVTRQVTLLGVRSTDVPLHAAINGNGSRITFATRRTFLGNSDGSVDLYSYDIPSSTFGRVTNGPSNATAEVLSSMNDDGALVAFNFPRALTGVANNDFANTSEIYVTGTPVRPAFGSLTILNGASFDLDPSPIKAVAPDSIAVARGSALAFTTEQSQRLPDGTFPMSLGGTTVAVNGRQAQIFFVSPSQVNFHVPRETELGTAEVTVTNSDGFQSRAAVPTLNAAPGVFTFSGEGLGEGVILNADTLQPGPFDPSNGNLRLIIFSTGARNGLLVSVTAGGRALTVESIMQSPNMPGLDEIHVLVPADLRGAGTVDLVLNADGRESNPVTVEFGGDARRDILINEYLSDPPGSATTDLNGDANHDDTRSASQDEFVELVSTTTHDIDIGAYQLVTRSSTATSDTVRHTFASGTILPACAAIVVFGGGNPNGNNPIFGGAQVLEASSGSLSLSNSGGVIMLRDSAGTNVNFVSYGGSTGVNGNAGQSITRSPDISGSFTLHQSASGSGGLLFSPGSHVNGTAFNVCQPPARIEVTPPSATIRPGAQQLFTARAFDSNNRELSGVIFQWNSSSTTVATIDGDGLVTGGSGGTSEITATARGIQSAPSTLTVQGGPPPVVISEFRTRGPNGASDEFIEIYNNSDSTIDISGWKIKGSNTAGSVGTRFTVNAVTTLPARRHFLATDATSYSGSVPGDQTYSSGISNDGGIALTLPNDTIVDQVGLSAGSAFVEGMHLAPLPSNADQSYERKPGGASGSTQDTNDNFTDFQLRTLSDAQNLSSTPTPGGPTPTPTPTSSPTPTPSPTATPVVVISQVYGGGGNSGAPFSHDFVEVFNRGSSSVNITQWSVQHASATSSSWSVTPLCPVGTCTLSPGQYLLVQEGSGGAVGAALPTPDATGTANLSAGSGKIALASSTTPLSGSGCPFGATIADFVGYGATAGCIEGSGPAPPPSNTTADFRQAGGCTDTNDNAADFLVAAPNPRNTSSPINDCSAPQPPDLSINDVTVTEGNSGLVMASFTVSLSAPAPAGGITFNIATQDNTATSANNDYVAKSLTSQKISAGQQTYTFNVTISGDTAVEADETFFVNLTNVSGANVSDGQCQGTIQNDDAANLVISQLYGGGGNSGATYLNDFVEIFNRGTTSVDLAVTPYSIQYAGATSNFGSSKVNLTSGIIAPGGYFLVQLSGGANGASLSVPDAAGSITMAATAGKVALVVGTAALPASTCPGDDSSAPFNPNHATIVDFLGYGNTAICYEGIGPAPPPSNTTADFRQAGGCTDTNDNAADFLVAVPAPRNTSSPLNDCSRADLAITKSDSDDLVTTGSNVTYTITVTNNGSAVAQNAIVTDNLPAGVAFVSCNSTGGGLCGGSGNNRTVTFSSLAGGASATISLVATVNSPAGTTISNTATVTSNTPDSNAGNNSFTAITAVESPIAPQPMLAINDVSLSEGNSGLATFTFTISLSSPASGSGVNFDISTQDNTATTASGDYVSKTLMNQTITAGNASYTFDVTVNGDTLVETDEGFFVNVTNVVGATVLDGVGQGIVQNDDTANLVISQLYGGGGNTGAQFTQDFVEIFNSGTTTVNLSGWSVQYLGATGTGNWSATSLSGMIQPGQYYLVQEGSGGAVGSPLPAPDATGTIAMAATAGKVALVSNAAQLSGGCPAGSSIFDLVGYGSTAICFEGSGPTPAPSATSANFRKAGGCTDTNENAANFFVHAPGPRNTSSPINNCVAGPPPNLAVNDVTVMEGNAGAITAIFTVRLSAPPLSTDITFDIATADGTAQDNNPAGSEDNDYVAKTLTNQIIPAGQQTYTFAVTVNGDTVVEPNETFFVNVANVSGAALTDGQGVGTIQYDDVPTLTINDVSLTEGNGSTKLFTFTVSLSTAAPSPVTFDIATGDNTAQDGGASEDTDYVARNETAQTIGTGLTSYTFDVTVNGDLNIEANEAFFVKVSNVSGAIASDGQGQGTIQNDDSPTLRINDVTANEGDNGTTAFTFTVTSSLPAPAGGITFDIATQDNAATAGNDDYVTQSLTSQTMPATQTSYTFHVTVNGDTFVEPNETFFVNVTNVSGATVSDGQGQGTIQNDDAAFVVISQLYGAGGNTGATLRNDFIEVFNRGAATVDLAGWSVQYTSATGTTWQVTPLCPTGPCLLLPGRYFLVQEGSGGANGALLATPDATGTIAMAAAAGKVALVNNTTALTGSGCPFGGDVLDFVGYGTTANCFEGAGRTPAPGASTAEVRRGGGCVDTNDNVADFFLHAPSLRNSSYPANSCSGQNVDLTINDVTVTETNAETVAATFTVTLHGSTGLTVTVDYSIADGTANSPADYQAITTTQLVFNPGDTSKTITVNVYGDTLDEPEENFFVNLTSASNGAILDNQGLGTINDDDVPPTLTINDVAVNEGSGGTTTFAFTVLLSAPALTGGVTFDIGAADGSAEDDNPATEDNDYVAQSIIGQTIPAGSQDFVFNVAVNGDSNTEGDETFFVNVTNVSGATVSDAQGQGTIQNDDSPTLSIDDVTANEGDAGATVFTFTVTSSLPAPAGGITFDIATADGTAQDDNPATEENDYVTQSLTSQTIPEGLTTYIFQVNVNGDTKNEAVCETFFVNLSNAINATTSDPQGQGSITDEDGTKLVISQIYGGGGNASAIFTNDFIEIFNRGSTAASLNGMSVQYSAATSTTGNYSVTALPNVMLQPGQYFLIQEASGGGSGSPLPTPDATGTIAMAAGAGKVALVNGTSALPAAGCPSGANIIDFVGYGSTANCREGASTADNAPGPSNNTTSAQRKLTGCHDVNINQQDFFTAAVVPRNTATALSACSCNTSFSSLFILFGSDSSKDELAFLNYNTRIRPSLITRAALVGHRIQNLKRTGVPARAARVGWWMRPGDRGSLFEWRHPKS